MKTIHIFGLRCRVHSNLRLPAISSEMYFEELRQSSQSRLVELLTKISPSSKPKDFVIHDGLMKAVDQVAGARLLRETGVDKMFKLDISAPVWKNHVRIYFIPSTQNAAELIIQHLTNKNDGLLNVHYHLIVFPKALTLVQSLFESSGILDFTTIHNFCWDLIPLDRDFLSLELSDFFTTTFLQGDDSYLGLIAKVLMSFECHYGKFSSVISLGEKSHKTFKLLSMWHSEFQPPCPTNSEFSHLFIVDRNYDFAAPLLTQLTYEGVLDENFRIETGFIYLKGSEGSQRLMLNCAKDEVYAEIKGKHISAVFQHLSAKAKTLQSLRDKKNTDSIEEMKNFVSNELKVIQMQQKFLAAHISACEQVMKKQDGIMEELLALQHDIMSDSKLKDFLTFLEDSMARQVNFSIVLRLLSLYCLMQDGLSEKEFSSLQKSFLQAYGYKHFTTLHRLQNLGLFYQRDTKMTSLEPLSEKLSRVNLSAITQSSDKVPFKKICQRLNLLAPEDVPEPNRLIKESSHPSYVYGGIYTPLIYRVVEKFLKEKEPMAGDLSRCFGPSLRASNSNYAGAQQGKILVFFLGGVTLAETAALTLLSQQMGRHIAVASTSTLNGYSLIETVSS